MMTPPQTLFSPCPALGAAGVSESPVTVGSRLCRTQQGLERGWILLEGGRF